MSVLVFTLYRGEKRTLGPVSPFTSYRVKQHLCEAHERAREQDATRKGRGCSGWGTIWSGTGMGPPGVSTSGTTTSSTSRFAQVSVKSNQVCLARRWYIYFLGKLFPRDIKISDSKHIHFIFETLIILKTLLKSKDSFIAQIQIHLNIGEIMFKILPCMQFFSKQCK